MGEGDEGIEKSKLVFTEWSSGCGVQHKEYSQRYSGSYVWCQMGAGFIGMDDHLVGYVVFGHCVVHPETSIVLHVNCNRKIKND